MSEVKIKIGCDPELFIRDTKSGKYVSAAGFFPGTKKEPFKVDKGAVQVDGTSLEFNIDPAETEAEFLRNIQTVVAQMEEMVSVVNKDWILDPIPLVTFDKEIWDKIPEEAKILGCDPDYECLKGNVNPNPTEAISKTTKRTGSGHIHIGWSEGEDVADPLHFEDCRFIAKGFHDKRIFQAKTPLEFDRLKYYGMNGSFRPKSYGVELRSPSNTWMMSSEDIKEVFRKSHKTFNEVINA